MPLQVLPVVLADFDALETFTEEQGGTLIDPMLLDAWPVSTSEEADRRNKWSAAQNRRRFRIDKSARFVKVIDTDLEPSDQIISLARWHDYPEGFPLANTWMEVDVLASPPQKPHFPDGLKGEEVVTFLDAATKMIREWHMTANRCWMLTTLITRSEHRRRGAGGLLVKWGADQASAAGCVACLAADPAAQSMYAKQGFLVHEIIKSETMIDGLVKMYKPPQPKVNGIAYGNEDE